MKNKFLIFIIYGLLFSSLSAENLNIKSKKISIDKNFANIKHNFFSDKYRFTTKIVKELNNLKKIS